MVDNTAEHAGRRFGLDLIRALAIVLVMVSHSVHLGPLLHIDPTHRLQIAYHGGYFGVELFFVLSGYLIGTILLRLYGGEVPPDRRDLVHFWVRRWCRTLPNYYLFLILNLTLFAAWFGVGDWHWGYFLFLQNFAWPPASAMPESWSLAVEEWFYLLAPLALGSAWLLPRSRRAVLLAVLLAFILVCSLARAGVALQLSSAGGLSLVEWDTELRKVTILRLDAIAWGALISWLTLWRSDLLERHWRAMALIGLAMLATAALLLTLGISQDLFQLGRAALLFPLTGAGFACLLPAAARCRQPPGWLAQPVAAVSLVSYSAYLVHLSLVIPLLRRLAEGGFLSPALELILYVPLTLLISLAVYLGFERPMTSLRRFHAPGRATRNTPIRHTAEH